MIEDLTREERLLVNLAKASCAGKQSSMLDQWFDELDAAGWLIELARVHVRLTTGVSFRHQEFATALQLREGRAYRLLLTRDDAARDRAVAVARELIQTYGPTVVAAMQRTAAYARLIRELQLLFTGRRASGRRMGESDYAACPSGRELERMRLEAGLTLKNWAVRIGTSENTYRRRLIESDVPAEWLQYGAIVLNTIHDGTISAASAAARAEFVVTDEELKTAFARVWQMYLLSTGTPAWTPPVSKEEQNRLDDEALMTFVPSPEDDGEYLELDVTIDPDTSVGSDLTDQPIDQ